MRGIYPVRDCQLVLETTQLRNVYLADLIVPERCNIVNELPQVSPREVNMQRETEVALEYAAYQLHKQIKVATQQQQETLENVPVQTHPGHFGLAHGGLFHSYNCKPRTAEATVKNF